MKNGAALRPHRRASFCVRGGDIPARHTHAPHYAASMKHEDGARNVRPPRFAATAAQRRAT
jgi:hypothetical protein